MSHRTDWRVLETHDPIPGNAPELKEASGDYGRVRQAITDAREALDIVLTRDFTEAMISAAVDEVKESAKTIRDSLGDIAGRYEVAAVALEDYSGELADAQTAADEAEGEAQQAQAVLDEAKENKSNAKRRRDSAQSAVTKYQDNPSSETESSLDKARQNRSNAQNDIWDADADIQAAQTRISNARTKLNQAITKRDEAADDAAQKIRNQINNDGMNDTWWDNWGSKIAGFLVSIANGFIDAIKSLIEGIVALVKAYATLFEALYALSQGDWDTFTEKLASGLEQYLEAISTIAGAVATICGTLALVCSFIPCLQPLGIILGTISRIASVVHLVVEAGLALKEGLSGEGWDRMERTAWKGVILGVSLGTEKVVGNITNRISPPANPGQVQPNVVGPSVSPTVSATNVAGQSLRSKTATVIDNMQIPDLVTYGIEKVQTAGTDTNLSDWNRDYSLSNIYRDPLTAPVQVAQYVVSGV